jgi:hypothetical protein
MANGNAGIEGFDPQKFLAGGDAKPFDPQEFLRGAGKIVSDDVPKTPPKEEQRSIGQRISTGFMDPVYGAAQLGARMEGDISEGTPLLPPLPAAERDKRIDFIDNIVRQREAGIKERAGEGIDWWREFGSATNPLNYGPALIGGLPGAAAVGFMQGLTAPVTETDKFLDTKINNSLRGMAFGIGGGAITEIAGRAVSPIVGHAARQLMDRGVELTPGRLMGTLMSNAEDAGRSIPWLGWFIKNAAQRSNASFNVAAINTALEPLGRTLPQQIPAGRGAVDFLHQTLSDAYDNVLLRPGVGLDITERQFLQDLAGVQQRAIGIGHNSQTSYEYQIHQSLGMAALRGGGRLTGQDLKNVDSDLGRLAADWHNSTLASERQLGDRFEEAQRAVRQALERQNITVSDELGDINQSYAMFKRIQYAAQRRAGAGKEEGVFTPMDLAAGVKNMDPSKDKASFARGDALMQEFAEWGLFVLPQRVPDSGTTERALWAALGLGAGTIGLPAAAILAAKASLVGLPYIPPALRLLNRYAQTGARRQAVRAGVQRAAPFVGGVAGSGLGQHGIENAPEGATSVFDALGNLVPSEEAKE